MRLLFAAVHESAYGPKAVMRSYYDVMQKVD
jgi:hypothetical protein